MLVNVNGKSDLPKDPSAAGVGGDLKVPERVNREWDAYHETDYDGI